MKQHSIAYLGISRLLILSLFFTSCYTPGVLIDLNNVGTDRQKENTYYVPSAPITPLITKKNDFVFDTKRSSGSKFTGADIQAAYMPGRNIALCAAFFAGGNTGSRPDYMKHHRFEAGTGYVKKLRKGWHVETYAGLGSGKIRNTHYSGSSHITLRHFFIQPAIAISNTKQTVQLAFSSRMAGVRFNITDTSFTTGRELFSTGQLNNIYDQPFHVMWEPSLIFRAGWKNILFNTQFTCSSDLTDPGLYRSKTNFSAGVIFRFNTKKE